MKLPDRHDRYMISTMTATGLMLLAAILFADLSAWWLFAAIPMLFVGHSQEYQDLRLIPRAR